MSRFSKSLVALVALLLVPALLQAQGNDRRSRDDYRGFTSMELNLIKVYFADHPIEVKPLPPGIVKRLEWGKPLPPGIAKRQLPPALVQQLPPRDPGAEFEVTIFGDRIVLLEARGLIVDVLEGVFGG